MKCDRVQLPELLRGELSEEETGPVLAHLERCTACRERARLMALLQGEPTLLPRRKPRKVRFRLAAAAAICVLLVGLGVYLALQRAAPTSGLRELATSAPYPLVALTTRSTEEEEVRRAQAFEEYRGGDFVAAAESFAKLESAVRDPDIQFFWGVAAYLADDFPTARRQLERTAELSEKWAEASLWYLANLELKLGNAAEALRRLEALRARRGEHAEAAERLLEKLERNP